MYTGEFLPVGTVININGINQKVVITGYCLKNKNTIYDYCGVLYPGGLNKKGYLYFNKNDINRIKKIGYMDDECKYILEKIKEYSIK